MNTDFPRIITLLRKERGISQKQAASDLGVSQALLSHYEKGIRECGLEFLVKTADYYGVSCDYILGRCAEPSGGSSPGKNSTGTPLADSSPSRRQNTVLSSIRLIFSLSDKTGSDRLDKEICKYLSLAAYRIFRLIYSANPRNDRRFFTVSEKGADGFAAAAMSSARASAECAAEKSGAQGLSITTNMLSESYPECASSMLNLIKSCEENISAFISSDGEESEMNKSGK